MSGGIYSGDKCPICGGRMVDNHRDSVSCPARHRADLLSEIQGVVKKRLTFCLK